MIARPGAWRLVGSSLSAMRELDEIIQVGFVVVVPRATLRLSLS
jgi:hypothetical protein